VIGTAAAQAVLALIGFLIAGVPGALGLGIAGVDLIRSSRGPLVLEVNSTPGLEGIEGISQDDLAGKIIEHVAAQVAAVKKPVKSKN